MIYEHPIYKVSAKVEGILLFRPSGSSNLCNLPNHLATQSLTQKGYGFPCPVREPPIPFQCQLQPQSKPIPILFPSSSVSLRSYFISLSNSFLDELFLGQLVVRTKTKTRLEVASDGH